MGIPQFEKTQPILQVQKVNSQAEGFESFAKAFGDTADAAEQKGESLEVDASHTMFLQSQSQLSHLENQTKLDIAAHPGQTQTIIDNTKLRADEIKKNAYVNKKDRTNLNYIADNTVDTLSFDAKKQQIDLTKQQAMFTTLTAFQSNVDKYSTALWSNDPKQADIMQNAMIGSIRGQIAAGVITGIQGAAMMKSMSDELKRHELFIQQSQSENATASNLHTLNAFGTDSMLNSSDMPANELTTQLVSTQQQYSTVSDIKSAYANGKNVSPLSFRNIKKASEIATLAQYKYGAAEGIGLGTSAESFPVIENEIKRLDSIKQPTEHDKGKRDALTNYVNDFKNGEGLKHIFTNPLGIAAKKTYLMNISALDSLPMDAEAKQQLKSEAHNQFLTDVGHVYEAMHVPEQYRTMFSRDVTQMVDTSLFNPNGDINAGLNLIFSTKSDSRPYLANSMQDPHKAMVVYSVGRLQGNADKGFITDLVTTQKDGFDYSGLNQSKAGGVLRSPYSDAKIQAKLEGNSNLSKVLLMQNSLPAVNGTTANQAMIDMGIKYIKGKAVMNGDYNISKFNTYLNDFVSNMSQAYDPVSGYNHTIDRKVIPLNDLAMSQVANNVLRHAYKTLFDQHYSVSQIEEMFYTNPYKVVSTPTGHLVVINAQGKKAVDKDGHVLFDMPYASTMLDDAHSKDGTPVLPIYAKRAK